MQIFYQHLDLSKLLYYLDNEIVVKLKFCFLLILFRNLKKDQKPSTFSGIDFF